jgi:hypothetical protein
MLRNSLINLNSSFLSIVFVLFIISDNPIISIIGLPIIPLFILLSLILFFVRPIQISNFKLVTVGVVIFFFTSLTSTIINNTEKPLLFGILSILYFISTFFLSYSEIVRIVKILSNIFFVTLVLGLVAVLLGTNQWLKIMELKNLDLYPIGFLYYNIPIPRLAGFFYEPGQLSFYICICIVLREILSLDIKFSFVLLILGFLTQSISHLFFSLFFLLFIFFKNSTTKNKLKFIFGFLLFFYLMSSTGFFDWLFERINTFISQPEEWGRFLSFNNALTVLEDDIYKYFVGPNADLAARIIQDESIFDVELQNVSVYGENPLSPIIFGGILASWPYYFFIIFYLFETIRFGKYNFLVLIIALLTLQRPYTIEFPYTLIIAILVVVNAVDSKNNKINLNVS